MTQARNPVPVLLYHSVSDDAPRWIRAYTVAPTVFSRHLDLILESGCTPLTVSELCHLLAVERCLPRHPVVITFDDGFADFAEVALPAMGAREIVSTLYLTTGAIEGLDRARTCLPPAPMLHAVQLVELEAAGVELGAHSRTHPQLDVIPTHRALDEIGHSKAILEDALGHEVPSFAYPHGFYSPRVCQAVRAAGYRSACAVRNAISSPADDRFAMARLMVRADTSTETLRAWLVGRGAPTAPLAERLRTKAYRYWRRAEAGAMSLGSSLVTEDADDLAAPLSEDLR